MRNVKGLLIVLTGLFIVITLLSLLIPSKVKVTRTTVINSDDRFSVTRQISDIRNWYNWHPLFKSGNETLQAKGLHSTGTGAFEFDYAGKLIQVRFLDSTATSLHFLMQMKGENDVYNEVVISGINGQHGTQIIWTATTQLHWYPWEKFYGIFIDKLSGPGYELGLQNLKQFIESQP